MATPNAKPSNQKPKSPAPVGERLQKVLSRCGVASRRAAEALIVAGRVEVNGEVVSQLGVRVNPEKDDIRLDGERLKLPARRVVLALNKPVGFLCAAADPESRPLVYWLVPKDLALRSIGRLDFNTEGVLLFTNDGDLAERLGHARFAVQRVYEARVRGVPTEETLARLRMGVRLEDGPARAEEVAVVKQTDANCWLRLVLLEGRNREVRRLLERVGHPVVRLRRVSYAGVTTNGLQQGKWRLLDDREIAQLEKKGHVGGFALPPDPRKGESRAPQLSTGPGPLPQAGRRGAARVQTERVPTPAVTPAAPPSRKPVAPAKPRARGQGPAQRQSPAAAPSGQRGNRGRR